MFRFTKRFHFQLTLVSMAALHLEIVFVTLLLKFAWMENIARAPYGARMCRKLCMKTFGCSTYEFLTSELFCKISSDNAAKPQHGNKKYHFLTTKVSLSIFFAILTDSLIVFLTFKKAGNLSRRELLKNSSYRQYSLTWY